MRRWRRTRAPMARGQRARAACAVLALVLVVLTMVVLSHLRTLLGDLAVTRVSNSVNRLVVAPVSDAIESGEIQYDRLITLQKDNSGRITALQSNMAEFNRLQSAITEDVLHRLSQMSDTQLSIPIGTLTGSAVRTYSSTTAASIFFFLSVSAIFTSRGRAPVLPGRPPAVSAGPDVLLALSASEC